jgi:hypothetical protein
MPMKVLQFQSWRPLTEEERTRVPKAFWWVGVSRVKMRPPKGPEAPPATVVSINPESRPEPPSTLVSECAESVEELLEGYAESRLGPTEHDNLSGRSSDTLLNDNLSPPSSAAPQATSRQLIAAWDHYRISRDGED